MLRNDFAYPHSLFTEGPRFLSRGILGFGLAALVLAVLIFMFPAFIGVLVATFILIAGLLALVAAYRLRQLGDGIRSDTDFVRHDSASVHFHSPGVRRHRTLRFMAW